MDAELEKWVQEALDNNINGIESGKYKQNEYIQIKRGTLIGILAAIKQLNKELKNVSLEIQDRIKSGS